MLIGDGNLAIRLMRDDETDYATMARWLTDPRVLEFYEGRDNPFPIERIRAEYSPRIMAEDEVTPCLFVLDEAPIGYAQFYPISELGRSESSWMRLRI
jgi:aminoglycoside 6'-N-acetyltransferase